MKRNHCDRAEEGFYVHAGKHHPYGSPFSFPLLARSWIDENYGSRAESGFCMHAGSHHAYNNIRLFFSSEYLRANRESWSHAIRTWFVNLFEDILRSPNPMKSGVEGSGGKRMELEIII